MTPVNYFCEDNLHTKMQLKYDISMLVEREQQILFYHFTCGLTYFEIGKIYGISGNRVRQIFESVLRKLKTRWYRHNLEVNFYSQLDE